MLAPGIHNLFSQFELSVLTNTNKVNNFILSIDSLTLKFEGALRDFIRLSNGNSTTEKKGVLQEQLLEECYAIAERINGFSQLGVELSKQMLWAGMDAGSLHSHMNHEGHAQLFVRMTTKNFEEAIKARKEGRTPDFKD